MNTQLRHETNTCKVCKHQTALLKECRAALDELLERKPMMAALICGSTTLGNLRAELYHYRCAG